MTYVLALFACIGGIIASILLLTLLVAGSPNSPPEQLAKIKAWMLAITLVTAASLIGAAILMYFGRPWHAAGAGGFPMVFNTVAFVIMLRTMS